MQRVQNPESRQLNIVADCNSNDHLIMIIKKGKTPKCNVSRVPSPDGLKLWLIMMVEIALI